ncbi:hypothetical protein N9I22_00175 [Candidatus Pelagibacter sp.]|jgi:hypothetical protein|nr:hypothetical protein [Candidatus Pelagibacter sp.]
MNCDFSFQHYKEILEIAIKSNYKFLNFEKFTKLNNDLKQDDLSKQKICLLRHDVDYDFIKNYNLAKIEYDLGVKSTFFLQSSAWEYNCRDKESFKVVKEIVKMGHNIGVHLDISWYENFSIDKIKDYFERERKLLSDLLEIEVVNIFSYHNPHKFKDLLLNKEIPGLRNTYEPLFFSKIKYLSDSQGWYEECMCKIFKKSKYPKIQLLTHSYVWDQNPEKDFTNDIAKMISNKTKDFYEYMLNSHPVCKKNDKDIKSQIINKISKW